MREHRRRHAGRQLVVVIGFSEWTQADKQSHKLDFNFFSKEHKLYQSTRSPSSGENVYRLWFGGSLQTNICCFGLFM